jgi:hypothetical protein
MVEPLTAPATKGGRQVDDIAATGTLHAPQYASNDSGLRTALESSLLLPATLAL